MEWRTLRRLAFTKAALRPNHPTRPLAIGSSFPGDTNCGFMRFLSCLQIFVSHPWRGGYPFAF
jgi:hypothetical protein